MARYKTSVNFIHTVYIADGFADDCDELIYRCMQMSTLSYEKFCNVWKEMKFSCIFHGRTLASELAELSEEVLHVAKHYMVANTSNFEESVAGLFLVYALLNLQPIPKFAALRIVPEDIPAIERIQEVARKSKRMDVLYILGHVLIIGPCHYHAVQRERGMEFPIRKYLEGYTTIDSKGIRPKGVFYRQNEELDILRELTRVSKLYKEAKEKIDGTGSSDRDLNYVDDNFASELDSSLKNLINGIIEQQEPDINTVNERGEPSRANMIKEKAMRLSVKPMSHLTGLIDSTEETSPSKKRNSKSNPRKRTRKTKRGAAKRKRKQSTESEASDDNTISKDSDEEIDPAPQKDPLPQHNKDITQINIDDPPTQPHNKYDFEIEIIDEYQDKEANPLLPLVADETTPQEACSPENLSEIRDALQRRDVILTKVGNSSKCETTSHDVSDVAKLTKVTSDVIFKKPYPNGLHLGAKERRYLKKPRIKTRFQRMGISNVANFVEETKQKK